MEQRRQALLQLHLIDQLFQLHKLIYRFKTALELFDKLTAILCYGCEVWGFHPAPDTERVHLSFLNRVLSVKKPLQNDFIYGLLGMHPMRIIRQCRILSYWPKIESGTKSDYINVLFNLISYSKK